MATEMQGMPQQPQPYQDVNIQGAPPTSQPVQGIPTTVQGTDLRSQYNKLYGLARIVFWIPILDSLFCILLGIGGAWGFFFSMFVFLLVTGILGSSFLSNFWMSVFTSGLILINILRLLIFVAICSYWDEFDTGIAVGLLFLTIFPFVLGVIYIYFCIKFIAELTRITPEMKNVMTVYVKCACGALV
jgi:hypothetical protein